MVLTSLRAVCQIFTLEEGVVVGRVPGFVGLAERNALWDECDSYPWQQQKVRGVRTLRSNAWFADDLRVSYAYSGQHWQAHKLTAALATLRNRIVSYLEMPMNSVLATHYPNGTAAVGYHADDELLFGASPTIASMSLGATRTFQIQHRRRAGEKGADVEIELHDGDLLVMYAPFQQHYLHALKKTSRTTLPRLNFSYRQVVSMP